MKPLLEVLILAALVLSTCAKWIEPVSYKDILEIDHIYSTTGYARDAYVSNNIIYVAQDETGIIIFNRGNGSIIWEKNDNPAEYITVLEQDSFMISYDDPTFHTYNFANFDSVYEIGYGTLTDAYVRHPELITINTLKDTFTVSYITKHDFFIKECFINVYGFWETLETIHWIFYNKDLIDYEINEDYIYLAVSQWGLLIIDYNEQIIGIGDTPGQALALKIVGNYAYIADREAGLQVIDISDIENPELIYSFDTSGLAQSVDVEEDYLVVGSGGGGVYLFDVSDKATPKFLDRLDDYYIGYTYKAILSNGEIFVATKIGVVKLKIND
ncbi:MAG: hypothetical protein KAW92_05540 [Candidatus Cloacimonetes bacterium]|nr:hypothetical protein [Candidatus Cloacimonadota bacterium]